jgi:O-antigen/teichoic acid export membrane protein
MLLKRLFATTTGAIVSKGAAIITALLLFRQLPAADMGRYTAALTLVGFCAILGNAGLNPLTTREIARRGTKSAAWWASIAPLRLLLALAAYGLLVGIALFVPALVDRRLAIIAGLLLIPDALAAALAATLAGLGRAALASWLDALRNLVGLAATLALILLWRADVLALAWLCVGLAACALVINGLALLRGWAGWWLNRFRLHPNRLLSDWRRALGAALPLGLGALTATLYFRVDTLFLSATCGGQAVAYYSAPYQIVESFWLLSTSWDAVALPVLARHYSPRFVERSVALLVSIGLPASLVITFRAEDVARLVFGAAYLPAALPLRLVIWVVPILFSYVPLVTALFVHDRQRHVFYILLANLALVLLLDTLLIPPYGALGASIATLLVEAGALTGYLLLAWHARLGIHWAHGLVQPALISLPLGTILLIGQALPFIFILPPAILLWAALFGLLRPWKGAFAYPQRPQFQPPGTNLTMAARHSKATKVVARETQGSFLSALLL